MVASFFVRLTIFDAVTVATTDADTVPTAQRVNREMGSREFQPFYLRFQIRSPMDDLARISLGRSPRQYDSIKRQLRLEDLR